MTKYADYGVSLQIRLINDGNDYSPIHLTIYVLCVHVINTLHSNKMPLWIVLRLVRCYRMEWLGLRMR